MRSCFSTSDKIHEGLRTWGMGVVPKGGNKHRMKENQGSAISWKPKKKRSPKLQSSYNAKKKNRVK